MFASRLSSFSSLKRSSCRRSCPNARTTRMPESVSWRYAVTNAIFSLVSRYAPAEAMRNHTLPIASSGKLRKVTSASRASSANRIAAVPISVSDDENSVTTPSVTSWSSASTSFVIREISTPALLRSWKPIDRCIRWSKIFTRRSCSARSPTQLTR